MVEDKGYDDEKNHRFVREYLLADSIISARFESIPVLKLVANIERRLREDIQQTAIPSAQQNRNHFLGYQEDVWRMHKVKDDKDKEPRTGL